MRLRVARILLNPLVALASISLAAATEEYNACPPKIAVSQTVTGQTPEGAGWSDYGTKDEHPFVTVSFFSGPPDQKASLAPFKEKKEGRNTVATWTLPKSNSSYWVACEYAGTSAMLAKALSEDVHTCIVKYDGRFSSPVATSWRCYPVEAK